MAEELRCVTIKATIASGQTVDDNVASFTNGGGKDISIRKVHLKGNGNGMDAGDSFEVELSMDPTILSSANGDQTKRVAVEGRSPEQLTASTTSGGHVAQILESFAKSQWILEPGDDVHINSSSTSTTSILATVQLWYHFN